MTAGGIIGPNHPMQQRANELQGYHVVPRQLAYAGDDLKSTASMLSGRVVGELESTHLGENDLGFLGKHEGSPADYNGSMRECVGHFKRLATTLHAAGDVLNQVAAHYAAMDDSYYEKFNRFDDH
ncbi:hypothetical protein SK803_38805 [Lentzea sp. BCCO 10_0856]|uniref:Excreted virulence factor EspC, type VII ESX diderm n=1 Tax=Lentzea miocenica TaxID=3095431 RepID=A0ABU4TDC7_9PSEU|nr:hypothetical protein [Lentzea sp. BCCO 10_0856]MDX8036181.1 hypothetical protein [Lentzea sp. BCCO 10_0856]